MAGTNLYTHVTDTLWVALTEAENSQPGGVQVGMQAKCLGTPPATPGLFEHGCIMDQTDGTPGTSSLFENTGTIALPVWTPLGTSMPGSLALTNGHIFVGDVTNHAADVAMSGDATITNAGVVTVNKQADLQFQDEGVNLGTSGTADTVNFVGTGVTATRVSNTVTVTVPSGSGLAQFGYFWQSVTNVAGTIAADNGKALFHTASSNNTSGFTMVPDSGNITVLNGGTYEIDWSLSAAEPGAMCVYVNNTKEDLAGATYGSGAGTQQNTGKTLLVLAANDVISLRTDNCAAALTLQLAGTTNVNQVVASIMIKKVA